MVVLYVAFSLCAWQLQWRTNRQEALLSQRPRDALCLYSFNTLKLCGYPNSNICLFVLTWSKNVKKSPSSRTAAHIFLSPGDAPATITQYVAWMERQFSACQTTRSMYISIFNSFGDIWCLVQCVSPKIAIFTTFLFPLRTLWGNHAKCCMDGKRIRYLQILSEHVPIYLQQFPRYSNRKCKKIAVFVALYATRLADGFFGRGP